MLRSILSSLMLMASAEAYAQDRFVIINGSTVPPNRNSPPETAHAVVADTQESKVYVCNLDVHYGQLHVTPNPDARCDLGSGGINPGQWTFLKGSVEGTSNKTPSYIAVDQSTGRIEACFRIGIPAVMLPTPHPGGGIVQVWECQGANIPM
jgi:hypothetical protein